MALREVPTLLRTLPAVSGPVIVHALPGPTCEILCATVAANGREPVIVGAPERVLARLAGDCRPALVLVDLDRRHERYVSIDELGEVAPSVALVGISESPRRRQRFLEAGGRAVLDKPLDPAELEQVLYPILGAPHAPKGELRGPAPEEASPHLRALAELGSRATSLGAPILITGETGVGKSLLARAIHRRSPRRARPFVTVLCPAMPRHLLESELFGYQRGAFSGASSSKPGRLQLAHGGIAFLDEIGDLELGLQAKLLQVLESGVFTPLGSNRERRVDLQLICATSADLRARVEEGRFRRDLFERIQVVPLMIEPLRERRDEIPLLLASFLDRYSRAFGLPRPHISSRLAGVLRHHEFAGNVRELENLARRLVALGSEAPIFKAILASRSRAFQARFRELLDRAEGHAGDEPLLRVSHRAASAAEREVITQTLYASGWNRRQAARRLGVAYPTLLRKMHDLEIAGP